MHPPNAMTISNVCLILGIRICPPYPIKTSVQGYLHSKLPHRISWEVWGNCCNSPSVCIVHTRCSSWAYSMKNFGHEKPQSPRRLMARIAIESRFNWDYKLAGWKQGPQTALSAGLGTIPVGALNIWHNMLPFSSSLSILKSTYFKSRKS